ncbi:MAG: hypothetical protein RJB11_516, partial [Planctomycetota bacterium]
MPPPFEQPISLALGSLAWSGRRLELLDASSVMLGQIHLANFLISLRDFLKRRDRTFRVPKRSFKFCDRLGPALLLGKDQSEGVSI